MKKERRKTILKGANEYLRIACPNFDHETLFSVF